MAKLPEQSVDVVVTSPPYNLDISYGTFRDNAPRTDYLDWSVRWATEVRRLLKPDGSFFLNVGASPANPLLPHQMILAFEPLFRLQNTIHWIKSVTVQPRKAPELSVGHFKPINSRRYITDCHEYVFHLTQTGDVPIDRLAVGVAYADKSNITRWAHTRGAQRDRRCRGNNWFIAYETIQHRDRQRPHPATFPTQLAEWCFRLHGLREGMVALDPFLGIGHAATAAGTCGLERFIGFEIDAGYLSEARSRLGISPEI
jgi:site-specific DNA-methyltransferase (adenine-specific)